MTSNDAPRMRVEEMTRIVKITESRYGTRTPEIEVRIPNGASYRTLKAELFRLASEIEKRTPRSEGWATEVEVLADARGRVYLDLIKADDAEVERGLAVLKLLAHSAS